MSNKYLLVLILLFIFIISPLFSDTDFPSWNTSNGYTVIQALDIDSNSFIIEFQNNFLLIDTGEKSKWKLLHNNLDDIGVNQNNLKALILTHAHYDHVENAFIIKEFYGTSIIISNYESSFLENGISSPIGIFKANKPRTINSIESFIGSLLKYKAIKPDIIIGEEYRLDQFGFINCYIINTPGHTIGSVCVIIDNEIVLTGDTIVNVSNNTLPWYFVSKENLLISWKSILNIGCNSFLPAHGSIVNRKLLHSNFLHYSSK